MRVQSSDIFTERVNQLMKQCSLTKKDMAQRLNIDYSTFWRKLNGQRNVDMLLLKQIAEILGTSTAYLTGETDDPIAMPKQLNTAGYELDYMYWGSVVNNTRDIIKNGDKDSIAYVSQMLKRALSLLKLASKGSNTVRLEQPAVTNMPFIVGDNNESNLTFGTA